MNIEFSKDEILMMQELVKNALEDGGCQWRMEYCQALDKKLSESYQKPVMTREEYQKEIEAYRNKWKGKGRAVESLMVGVKRDILEFENEIMD